MCGVGRNAERGEQSFAAIQKIMVHGFGRRWSKRRWTAPQPAGWLLHEWSECPADCVCIYTVHSGFHSRASSPISFIHFFSQTALHACDVPLAMPTDPAAEPQNPAKPTTTTSTEKPEEAKPDVEYDDFGLPVRKPRSRTPLAQVSDSEEDDFKDAVESKLASKEHIATTAKDTVTGDDTSEKEFGGGDTVTTETPAAQNQSRDKLEPTVNGHKEIAKRVVAENGADDKSVKSDVGAAGCERSDSVDKRNSFASIIDRRGSVASVSSDRRGSLATSHQNTVSEYSHQQLAPQPHQDKEATEDDDGGWQTMPAYARFDMYDDNNKLIAKENTEELEDMSGYGNLGGAAKGYTRVTMDDDAQSQTSMDDDTAYLFKEKNTTLFEEDEAARDPLSQMQTTKELLTEGQRVAYVGLVRLAMVQMEGRFEKLERNRGTKKIIDTMHETNRMWAQKMMVRLYSHMDINESEQIMIEQLAQHGVVPADLTPALMQNARVRNPAVDDEESAKGSESDSMATPRPGFATWNDKATTESDSMTTPRPGAVSWNPKSPTSPDLNDPRGTPSPPPYEVHEGEELPAVRTPSQLPPSRNLDIDLRWTILCDLFLVLIADSIYDARSRQLLEQVATYLTVDWLEICRFEKRVTEALEMQEEANKENWNEDEHLESRRKRARNRRLAMMGLATVGGSLVIGLSAGLLAPVIGAGLAAGFTTIGVAGTSGFLAGAGGAAFITTTGVVSGGTIAVRAANRRTGAVKTFEYRPLHNNKRVNLIITLAGWMNGNLDDVRLPFSTVDPVMGDIYSVLWEPEMLRSMGDTINILATEVCSSILASGCSNSNASTGTYSRSPTSTWEYDSDGIDGSDAASPCTDQAILSHRQSMERVASARGYGRPCSCRLAYRS